MSTPFPVIARQRGRRTYLYLTLPVLMLAIALIGFWPQYYGRLLSGSALDVGSSHVLVHIHSSLFLGWLAILFAQAFFARAGRIDLHRRFGPLFATYGFGAAAVGTIAGLQLAAFRVTRGGALDEAAVFVAAPLLDMLMFSGFLTAAIIYRRRSEIHRTLMIFAAYSFAFIGLVRYLVRIGALENLWMWYAVAGCADTRLHSLGICDATPRAYRLVCWTRSVHDSFAG